MELSLVWVLNQSTGRKQYFAVNDRHYDAMLAGEIDGYEWGWLGDVTIEEHVLNEQNYYYKD